MTLKQYTPTDGNQVSSGAIKVRNLVLVAGPEGSANVIATIINSDVAEDTLELIAVNGQVATLVGESLTLPSNSPLIFGGESATAAASVPLGEAKPGQVAYVEMRFQRAGLVQTTALIREASLEFTPTP